MAEPGGGGTSTSTGILLATMPSRRVLVSYIRQEPLSLTIFRLAVHNLESNGMFGGSVSWNSKSAEKGLYLVTWGVSNPF